MNPVTLNRTHCFSNACFSSRSIAVDGIILALPPSRTRPHHTHLVRSQVFDGARQCGAPAHRGRDVLQRAIELGVGFGRHVGVGTCEHTFAPTGD